jgi:chemotaxis protein MotB
MRKKHPEHVNLERWLVSYADFITLLFAFFVVMYALSMENISKVKAAAESIRKAFGVTGGSVGTIDLRGKAGGGVIAPFDAPGDAGGGRLHNMPAGKTNTAGDPDGELQQMKELLEETISLELGVSDLSERMQMVYDSRGLVVRLAAKDFFEQDEIEVRPDLRPLLDRIGRVMSRTQRMIRIEGHTDPSEATPHGYPSDWELSSARAAWVAKYWIARFGIDPRRIGVAGYSHFRPLNEKGNEWARSKNRRIEIIILNNSYESP